jgi:DNA polymerase-3 subunit gamma/tau
MSYLVLARKWRPQTFSDLVGQEHVARTLGNALRTGRVAHAFVFTGVRGVGKTTSARILAKALNCTEGPTAEPCLRCGPCTEIADGADLDVQEIDGASYTGVDEVRRLQESLPYRPARDRHKIFIVDEVHMLSTAAWNAFLKTLEEPPPHVKFIFATTEVHKVPVTILSRCQRFDFRLLSTKAIAERLRHVIDAEKIAADDEAVRTLAREAAGSMRDAMSLLDQVIAWAGGGDERLTGDAVASVLGVARRSVLHRLGAAVVEGHASRCLDVVAELAEQGFLMSTVARDFLAHLRDLVVARVCEQPAVLLEVADEERADLASLAARTSGDDLSRLYLAFSRAYDDIVRSPQPRAALEMALVRLARRPALVPIDELCARLAEMEERLGGGAPTGGARGAPEGGGPARGRAPGPRDGPERRHGAPAEALATWRAIVARIAGRKAAVAAAFEHAVPLAVAPGRVIVGFERGSFPAAQATTPESLAHAREAASTHFAVPTTVEIDLDTAPEDAPTVASERSAELAARDREARHRVAEHPAVTAAIGILGATLREIRLPSDPS